MADRRDISIPVNLGFLLALVVASAFVAAPSPDQTVDMASPPPPAQSAQAAPASEPLPAAPPPAAIPLRLAAVSMPPVPDMPEAEAAAQQPAPDALPAPKQTKPEPSKALPGAQKPAIQKPATPKQIIPEPMIPKPMIPEPVIPKQVAQLTPMAPRQDNSPRRAPVQPDPLDPLTPSQHRRTDPAPPVLAAMSAAPAKVPAAVSQAEIPAAPSTDIGADQLSETMPALQPMTAAATTDMKVNVSDSAQDVTAPQAADWQVADRLMETAPQRLSLEFLWPADRQSHARIYAHLTSCLGVETGVVDAANRVHMGSGGGRSFNAALHSPFMRIVERPVDPRERSDIERIRDRRQVGVDGGRAVRVFRRSHDMWLLAALNRAFGGLPPNGRVTAEYELDQGGLYLGKLTLDGRPHEGRISLDRDSCV
ncbi:hypothetical protein AB3X55_08265 [Alphaproteobacteria bacterium LSUCC0719]